ncbi:hypothetical protein, variant 2 [Cladophialophora immunda]|uniref:Uncharacterized protein n=1 Tax=Cladophialophora immunda TaxID=569365 RepID=A0A0D2BSC7_9EURO|nr:uncharacterized protein PV07_12650 [Cladophialophora immunda]XP_016242163.1 hypothetical protein, variant 1 [Cladophialophora immunda]XP_016242164.1 hypothetical protein, variant 2 [Cladophialophora immunda]KIW21946.1 hypothetical protein PV07_12650 [Cladophialophora immunda]KIW21947.1 hypothetical protein, variant 1 [Cladophialophora immunda]KIW21948.1 hypothetical protein, variant 2 [Cladophialophora immunda]
MTTITGRPSLLLLDPDEDPANTKVAIIGLDATGLALAGHFMHRGCQVAVYHHPDSVSDLSSSKSTCSIYHSIDEYGGFYMSGAIEAFNKPNMCEYPHDACYRTRTIFITKAGQTKETVRRLGRMPTSKQCFLFVEGGSDWKELASELQGSAGVFNIPTSPYAFPKVHKESRLRVELQGILDGVTLDELEQSNEEGNARTLLGVILWPWSHSLGWITV